MQEARGAPGRNKLLLVFAAFLAPVVAAYLFYYVWPPRGGATNYGELIEPVTPASDLPLQDMQGRTVAWGSLRGKWLLLYAAPGDCAADCRRQLDALRRVRLLQGREQDRVRLVWLVTDADAPDPAVPEAVPGLTVLRDPHGVVAGRLPVRSGLARHLYIVDPLGNVMMRYDADPDLKRMGKDLSRLLHASQIG